MFTFVNRYIVHLLNLINKIEKKGNKSTSRLAEHTVAVRSDTSWVCCRGADN